LSENGSSRMFSSIKSAILSISFVEALSIGVAFGQDKREQFAFELAGQTHPFLLTTVANLLEI